MSKLCQALCQSSEVSSVHPVEPQGKAVQFSSPQNRHDLLRHLKWEPDILGDVLEEDMGFLGNICALGGAVRNYVE